MFKLLNVRVVTDEMKIKNNYTPAGEFKLNPKILRNLGTVDEAKGLYFTQLRVTIEKTEELPMPVNIEVTLKAIFKIQKQPLCEWKHIERFLRQQGVHILYPYIRSSLSALTGAAALPPIVLPVVNTFTMFKEDKEWLHANFGIQATNIVS